METVITWLTAIGQFVISKLPPAYVDDLERTLPIWAIGLGAAILFTFVLKVVTSLVFKIIMGIALVVVFLILLQSFNIPIFDSFTNFGN